MIWWTKGRARVATLRGLGPMGLRRRETTVERTRTRLPKGV